MLLGLAQILLKERVLLHIKLPRLEDGKQFGRSSFSHLGLQLLPHHQQGPPLQVLLVNLGHYLYHYILLRFKE